MKQFTERGRIMNEAMTDLVMKATSDGVTANEQISNIAIAAALLIAQIDDNRLRREAQQFLQKKTRAFVQEFRNAGVSGAVVVRADNLQ